MTTFSALLNKSMSDVERPKPMPQGSYVAMVQGLPRFDKSSKKQTEFVEFTLKLLAAGEDVDAEALAEMGGIADKTIKDTYYLTENSLWRLKEFLVNLGMPEDMSMQEAVEAAPGKQIGIFINHEPSQDGQAVFARVGKTFVVE